MTRKLAKRMILEQSQCDLIDDVLYQEIQNAAIKPDRRSYKVMTKTQNNN